MSGRYGPITLHEEIGAILRGHGNIWVTTTQIALEVNARGRYQKRDGSRVTDFQIHGRTRQYPDLFERDGSRARLRGMESAQDPISRPAKQSTSSRVDNHTTAPTRPKLAVASVVSKGSHASTALAALAGPGVTIDVAATTVPPTPGLYAIHADASTWRELGLGDPPDDRPLYVGKSEGSLLARDLDQHFGDGRTGSSTLRRSFAALLREDLGLRGISRNTAKPADSAMFGLSPDHDRALTAWMRARLRLSVWPAPPGVLLVTIETEVFRRLDPPLNLIGVRTPWTSQVKAARKVMADQARAGSGSDAVGR